ncbi:MAG: hypothetical protein FH753_12625 [Firmicutes bacterium]|nr:hypothetical protein [Bacillota bacterium]
MEEIKTKVKNDNCINCGCCIKVCPAKIFISSDNEALVKKQNLKYCINCDDCKAVCPKKAVVNKNLNTKEINNMGLNYESEKLLSFLEKRRSIRSYKSDNLSKEEKQYLNKVSSLAPKGGHTKSLRKTEIIIIESEELINEITSYSYQYLKLLKKKLNSFWFTIFKFFNNSLKESLNNTVDRINLTLKAHEDNINMLTYDAPNLIILHAEKDNPVAQKNLTIMEYQLMLGAEGLNLGTCFLGWVSFALQSFRLKRTDDLKEIYEKLEIPANRKILSAFSIGRKRVDYKKLKSKRNMKIAVK